MAEGEAGRLREQLQHQQQLLEEGAAGRAAAESKADRLREQLQQL